MFSDNVYSVLNMLVHYTNNYFPTRFIGNQFYDLSHSEIRKSKALLDFKQGIRTQETVSLEDDLVELVVSRISKVNAHLNWQHNMQSNWCNNFQQHNSNGFSSWSIFIIPASTPDSNARRYNSLLSKLKARLPNVDFINDYMIFCGTKRPNHIYQFGKKTRDNACCHIRLRDYIRSNRVLIIDDLVNNGDSMFEATKFLQSYGAKNFEYCAISKNIKHLPKSENLNNICTYFNNQISNDMLPCFI